MATLLCRGAEHSPANVDHACATCAFSVPSVGEASRDAHLAGSAAQARNAHANERALLTKTGIRRQRSQRCRMSLRIALGFALLFAFSMHPAQARESARRGSVSKEVDAAVLQQMKEQKIPGIGLAVVVDGRVVKAKGYGLANIELGTRVTPDTVFEAGSITKQFTAAAIMLLVEDGKIQLDDSISKYFPEAPSALKAITIRHLLTHTSGIPDVSDGTEETSGAAGVIDFHRDYTEDQLARAYL